jgi:hypothetical protein
MEITPLRGAAQIAQCCFVCVLCASVAQGADAAPQVHPLVSSEAYEQILNLVFPHPEPSASVIRYEMILRFMPSSHSESEVVIDTYNTGKIQAWLFQVSGPSAWNTANQYIQKSGREDIAEISKLVQTSKHEIMISPEQAEAWYSACLKSLRQACAHLGVETSVEKSNGTVSVFLDGSTYELWFTQGTNEIHWRFMDQEVNDSAAVGDSPLAKWMNGVRRYTLTTARKGGL